MERVYLLWLHDMVLDVFKTRRKARMAAKRFRNQSSYRDLVWRSKSIDRWSTVMSRTDGGRPISRLEIEEKVLR